MARKGGNPSPTFCGKKGRSGRYSVADEALKNRVKHKAWAKTEAEMDKNIASQIVLKDMTIKTEFSGNLKLETITGMVVKKDGDTVQNQNKQADTGG